MFYRFKGIVYPILFFIILIISSCSLNDPQDSPSIVELTEIHEQTEVSSSDLPESDEIVVVLREEPENLAWHNTGLAVIALTRNGYEPLITRDKEGNLSPALAKSWEQVDDNTWRFHLQQNVNFHDGEPFDANVVAWHIKRLYTPEFSGNVTAKLPENKLIAQVIDKYTIDIQTETPNPILPRHMYWLFISSPRARESDPEFRNMIGTGPYKLEEWSRGESIVLVANPDYWDSDSEPAIKKVTFIWRESAALRLAMVLAGEADIGQALFPEENTSVRILTTEIPETPFIRLDPTPPLDDIRVRKAICMAIDREAIIEHTFSGFASPATQLITPDVMGFNPDIPLWSYDPNQARALIEEARVDGVPVDLRLNILGRTGMYANATETMENLQLWLIEIGLNVNLEMLDTPTWLEMLLTMPVPEDRRAIFQSSHGNEAGDGIFTMNAYYHSNARQVMFPNLTMDELISEASSLIGEPRQQALAKAMDYQHNEIVQDCPMVHLQAIWGVSERIEWAPRFDNLILISTVSTK